MSKSWTKLQRQDLVQKSHNHLCVDPDSHLLWCLRSAGTIKDLLMYAVSGQRKFFMHTLKIFFMHAFNIMPNVNIQTTFKFEIHPWKVLRKIKTKSEHWILSLINDPWSPSDWLVLLSTTASHVHLWSLE